MRFISHPDAKYNEAYLQQWAIQVGDWLNSGKTVYFFVHCPIEDYSPDTANYFKSLLEREGISTDNISTNAIDIPTQLSLF